MMLSRRACAAAVATPLVVLALASAPAGAQPAPVPDGRGPHVIGQTALGKLGGLAHSQGRRTVFVQLSGDGAAAASRHAFTSSVGPASTRNAEARSAALSRRSEVGRTVASVLATARAEDPRAGQLFEVSNAVPGVALNVDSAALAALAGRPDVVKISPIVPKHADNASAAQLTKVLDTWQNTHDYGAGVRVGIIDTGIDFTHADFGGPGTADAYTSAKAASTDPNWRAALPAQAQAKIAGGYDFVGDDYNADPNPQKGEQPYQPVPHPDADPLDCDSHGTHVAGTLAGYGENADGSTYSGDYSTLTAGALNGMKIGPGMAPQAQIYAFKIFGCSGSTDMVIPALDAALDPNGDGNFTDHLDIVNLSLGADYATPDDPENAVIDQLAANGVLPVIAMGNGGDLTDIGGAPGNAVRALAVASSVDAGQLLSGISVTAPAAVAGTALGQVSAAYPWSTAADVSGSVVTLSANNSDGCDPLSGADAARVNGQIAWLTWDSNDATRKCGSAARAANVKDAHAIGAILTGDQPVFAGGITGDPDIPVFQLTKTDSARLQPSAAAGTLQVSFSSSLVDNQQSVDHSLDDLLSSFSSRGTHGSLGVIKPDVTAPGDTITSAGMGSGNGVLVDSGTSMATPHTAGIAALVKARHPGWSVEQVKAAVMNTAGHDVYTGVNRTGRIYGPARVGAGRVDALAAVSTDVLAFDLDVQGGVSASFGVVEAPATQAVVTKTRTLLVQNNGTTTAALSLAYQGVVSQPGVTYSVSPATLTLAGGSSAIATVTMRIATSQLRHTLDPTMQATQDGVRRQYVSDASGRLLIAQSGKPTLRVPVYGAAKPVSVMSAGATPDGSGQGIRLTGTGVAQGGAIGTPTAFNSLASVMDFGASSPKLPACAPNTADPVGCTLNKTAQGGDIRYVGAGSSPGSDGTLQTGWLWFGISTWGDNATLGNVTIPYVDIDTTGDGNPDFEVYVQNVASTDVLIANVVDLSSGNTVDHEPVNFASADLFDPTFSADTNVFDTDAVVIPVWPGAIGVSGNPGTFPISYTVGEYSAYGSASSGGDIDRVGPVRFDLARPRVRVAYPLWPDTNGTVVPARVSAPGSRALVLHLHNASGQRAQVVTMLDKPAAPARPAVVAGYAAVKISWTAPAFRGTSALKGYDVQYTTDGGRSWHSVSAAYRTSTTTRYTISTLSTAARYAFRVAAINASGTGAYSAVSAAVRPLHDASAMTISPSTTVRRYGTVTVSTHLTDTFTVTAIAGAPVLLYARPDARHGWTLVARATTNRYGNAAVRQQIPAYRQFTWRYAGSTRNAAAASAVSAVRVS